ncbi:MULTISPECIES: ferredoxin--NADP reductase [unclassified Oleiphilus]|jgi:ferredoxin--NADP+ reductase|uniref:ferredoxin--NADP reductase n=2 Tax=Oleiphilus TaxID=141450 RepID=UPI0007C368F3|nr:MULTISPECIES: ferredoxin--NADP reductase [unclassified Oleiphilus]KZY43466.1 ferredoxin--NADP(+) reductase [Oleiphilus sp. HI0050]KZY75880.1 ferredoxin--NADP(+) reductase [Oleiphilus sp. HI0068]KZY77344.1 ferredoxin--NADP(+) reductase [Oleiphilus sp. HI0069]KZZ16587.1 ferredoxin--NADP(+) reductase [Oleiphilus sp. HI0078]KZZ21224.1 ferredoxin--NADP(+) reductase [Oleiphilus sp. HI0081]
MSGFMKETVTSVKHWNETLFSFTTSRDPSFRFKNGHFIMMGLEHEGKPLMRAYSIASANYEEELEFFSIKVPDGPLTSKLQKIEVGDQILLSKKPTGTLIVDNLLPGRNLYLISTGTGLAPFMSIIKDPETYELYDKVILTHGTRFVSELAYQEQIKKELPENEFFGEFIKDKLIYYPTVTRDEFETQGRITDALESGKLVKDLGLPELNLDDDRFMICGSPSMLKDTCRILDDMGFVEARQGNAGHYVIERAFVES